MKNGYKTTLSESELVINLVELMILLKQRMDTFSLDNFNSFYQTLTNAQKEILPNIEEIAKLVVKMSGQTVIHCLEETREKGVYTLVTPQKKEQYEEYFQNPKKVSQCMTLIDIVSEFKKYNDIIEHKYDENYNIRIEDSLVDARKIMEETGIKQYFNISNSMKEESHKTENDIVEPKVNEDNNKIIKIEEYRAKRKELEKRQELYKRRIEHIDELFALLFYHFSENGITTIDKQEFIDYFSTYNPFIFAMKVSTQFDRFIPNEDIQGLMALYFDGFGKHQSILQPMDEKGKRFYISLPEEFETFNSEFDEQDKRILDEIVYKYKNKIPLITTDEEFKKRM